MLVLITTPDPAEMTFTLGESVNWVLSSGGRPVGVRPGTATSTPLLGFSISPPLPAGLNYTVPNEPNPPLDPYYTSGVTITGTAMPATPRTQYVLTATDNDGTPDTSDDDTATLTFSIEIEASTGDGGDTGDGDEPGDTGDGDDTGDTGETPSADAQPYFDIVIPVLRYRVGSPIEPAVLPQALDGDGELTYGLSPELPEGLALYAPWRTIHGTPTVETAETTYAWTVTDEDGDYATVEFGIVVGPDRMPSFSESVSSRRYKAGRSAEPLVLPAATGGDGALTYGLSPALPEGLTLDTASRTVAGTPTVGMAETAYAWTATDEDGDVATVEFNIEVDPDLMPSFSESVPAQRLRVGSAAEALLLPLATGGDGALTYALSPALPAGLALDAATRTVTGTPTVEMAEIAYAWTATDEDGDVATVEFDIEVAPDLMPSFSESLPPQRLRMGSAVEDLLLPPATGGDEPLTYALSPALPAGLALDAATRAVTGTPTAATAATTYTWTATDADGDAASLQFRLEVQSDRMPSFTESVPAQRYRVDSAVEVVLPPATGGDGALTYGLSPALPAGLALDAATRTVTGTPTTETTETAYVWTATDEDGDVASVQFGIEVEPDQMPSFTASIPSQRYRAGSAIEAWVLPPATGGDGALTYGLSPALPAGLALDAATRTVTGTPTTEMTETAYVWTATDEDGDVASVQFGVEVEPDQMPSFTESVPAQRYRVDSAVEAWVLPLATGGDGALTYGLSPALPAGLALDAAMRTVTGTPTTEMTETAYVWTATDEDGDVASVQFGIEVERDLMPSFTASVSPQSYRAQTEIVDLVLPEATGGDGTLSYGLSPQPPDGLVLDVETRTLSGAPDAEMEETAYDWTATDEDGDSATLAFTISVGAAATLSIADASAGEGRSLEFLVELSAPLRRAAAVNYRTADGTAVAGQDYGAVSGTLTFAAGQTTRTIAVSTTSDGRPEAEETFSLVLSGASNAVLADARAIGTIADGDRSAFRNEALKGSLAAFGRTLAGDAVDAIGQRFQHSGSGAAATQSVAAPRLPGNGLAPSQHMSGDFSGPAAQQFGAGFGTQAPGSGARSLSFEDFVAGSAFNLNLGSQTGDGPRVNLWGRASAGGFDGERHSIGLDGVVRSGYVGVDLQVQENMLLGAALAHSAADVDFAQGAVEGEVDLKMTSLLPYALWSPADGVDVWAMLGTGRGDAQLQDGLAAGIDTDLTMTMVAAGARDQIAPWQGLDMALKADAFVTELKTDDLPGGDRLAADARRLRMLLEGSRNWREWEDAQLMLRMELGGRLDGGDVETGLGMEVGGGLEYRYQPLGLGMTAKGRHLLAHSDGDYEDWGISLALTMDPGVQGVGPSLTVAPSWGVPSGSAEELWRNDRLLAAASIRDDPRRQGSISPAGASRSPAAGYESLQVELGYGWWSRLLGAAPVKLYGALAEHGRMGRSYRFGGRVAGRRSALSLELARRERRGDPAAHGVLLTWRPSW